MIEHDERVVRVERVIPADLTLGSTFGMRMRIGVPYPSATR
jgi:hypothetical protein